MRSEGLSDSTIGLVIHSVHQFGAFPQGVPDVSEVSPDDLHDSIIDFRQRSKWQGTDQARSEPVSATTINTYVKKALAFWK